MVPEKLWVSRYCRSGELEPISSAVFWLLLGTDASLWGLERLLRVVADVVGVVFGGGCWGQREGHGSSTVTHEEMGI